MNFEKFTVKSQEAIRKIVRIQFDQIKAIAAGQQIDLEITDKALDHLAGIGFDPVFGARPLKRVIQKYITNELAKDILADNVSADKKVTVDIKDSGIIFKSA